MGVLAAVAVAVAVAVVAVVVVVVVVVVVAIVVLLKVAADWVRAQVDRAQGSDSIDDQRAQEL